jgi:hypothetical protein
MKVFVALIASAAGLFGVDSAAIARATGSTINRAIAQGSASEAATISEPEPISDDFLDVSVDSNDLITEDIGIGGPASVAIREERVVMEEILIQVSRPDFPTIDEIYRDPGPARANWLRVVIPERR